MNVKTIIQLIIFLIIIIFLYVFIKNTFLTDKKDIINLDTNIEKDIKIKKNLTKSDASNLIEKLNYKSIDALGNEYILKAEIGEESEKDPNILILKMVSGTIKLKGRPDIYISSDFAKYNSLTYDTYFYENVSGLFEENKIFSNNLDLYFKDNKAIMYNNIIFLNKNTKANADEIIVNLLNGDVNIKMFDKEKIQIIKN
tara:strand:+ start:448 stop:1044 length:597 start_codon:yes stop_codon:yes gene_type:complete